MYNTSSLANQHGVTLTLSKNKNQSPTKNIGLNPNLNIEDQYIENLLKQSHFMSLQIKLIKEKMKQSEGNGLWGLINRTKQPYVKNVVQSSAKYQQMKRNIDLLLNTMDKENVYLTNDQTALIKLLNFLEDRHELLEKKNKDLKQDFNEFQKVIGGKIGENNQRLRNILSQRLMVKKKHMEMNNEYERNLSEAERERIKTEHELGRIRNDEIIQQKLIQERQVLIDEKKTKNSTFFLIQAALKLKFQQNKQFQLAKEQREKLKQKKSELKKNIANSNFEILQLNESLRLAVVETDKEVKERKIITEQFQSVRVMLSQILVLNMIRKQKQLQKKKQQSPELRKAEDQKTKLEKNLEDIKRKLAKSQQTQKNIKLQIDTYQTQLGKLKEKYQQYTNTHTKLTTDNEKKENTLMEIMNQFRVLNDSYEKIMTEQYSTLTQHFDLQRKLQNLRGRKDFLVENLNVRDTLNEVKLEELQKCVQKNKDLNETVSTLMDKWQEVKSFSRM